MANPEHLVILKQGVEVWNKWRNENPNVKPNFRNANLQETNLSSMNLKKAVFNGCNLKKSNLTFADASEASFVGT